MTYGKYWWKLFKVCTYIYTNTHRELILTTNFYNNRKTLRENPCVYVYDLSFVYMPCRHRPDTFGVAWEMCAASMSLSSSTSSTNILLLKEAVLINFVCTHILCPALIYNKKKNLWHFYISLSFSIPFFMKIFLRTCEKQRIASFSNYVHDSVDVSAFKRFIYHLLQFCIIKWMDKLKNLWILKLIEERLKCIRKMCER